MTETQSDLAKEKKSDLATFRIDPEKWVRFRALAREKGKSASELLKAFVDDALSGRIDINQDSNLDCIDTNIEQRLEDAIAPIMQRLDTLDERLGKLNSNLENCAT